MAVRRHVVAGLNVDKDAFAEAFADLGHIEAEVTGPWTWFMATPWAVGSDQLIERMTRLPVTTLHMLTSDGCRWFLNLRGPGREPFSTCYEFYLATTKPNEESGDVEESDDEDDDAISARVVSLSLPVLHNVVGDEVSVAGDDFFNVDVDDDSSDEDEEAREPATPSEEMARDFAFMGTPLPEALAMEMRDLSLHEVYSRVLAWQVDAILEALRRFDVPHDPADVRDVLTGTSVTTTEWDQDIGNLPRFLVALGFGGAFEDSVAESEAEESRRAEYEPMPEPDPVGDMLARLTSCRTLPLVGGPPTLVPESVGLLACLAGWSGLRYTMGMVVRGVDATAADPRGVLSKNTMTWKRAGDGWHIASYLAPSPKDRVRIGRYISQLPEAAQVELLFTETGEEMRAQRYAGVIRDGNLELVETYPPYSARLLEEVMAFLVMANERVYGSGEDTGWEAESEQEVAEVLELARRSCTFYNDMPQVQGRCLRVKRDEMWSLVELFFRHRFRDTLGLHDVIREEAELAEELRNMDAEWDAEMSAPRTGVVLLQGESVRIDEADVSSLKPAELRKLKSADRGFLALGFHVLGNVCTPETGTVIMRAYGVESGEAYGAAYLNLSHLTGREYFTHFEEGGSLTTTTIDGIESIRRVGLFFRTSTARDLRQLYEEHQTGIAKLTERGFTPKRAEPTLEAFAAALADALHRRKLADL